MNDVFPAGKYVRGYLRSSDLTTPAVIPMFDADGNAYTQPVGTRLVITSLNIQSGSTGCIMTVFVDADGDGVLDSGEELWACALGIAQGNPPFLDDYLPSRVLKAGNVNRLMVTASAASANSSVNFVGRIVNG